MRKAPKSDIRKLIKTLEAQGWRVELNKHYKLYSPDPSIPVVIMAQSGGGGRGWQNALAFLRKCGADV